MKITKLAILGMILSLSTAYAHNKMQSSKMIPHQTITFNMGSSTLAESDKAALRKLIQNAKAKGDIDHITIAAWSDKALPRSGVQLADLDRDLADNRASVISDFLKSELDVSDVDTYNMAESSNWLARTFNTKDAELKSVFGKRGAETPVTKKEFQVIRDEGSPSEAVVVVKRDMSNYKK